MKVKTLRRFRDKHTGKVHNIGEVFTVNKERYEEILAVGQLVEEYKDEKKEKTAEKK